MTRRLLAALALCAATGTLSAQQPPAKAPVKTEHKMGQMDHAKEQEASHTMSPWKELDAYHMLMMATWHPAKDKSDMAPTRAKIGEMVASAKTLAASTAPKGCDGPKLKETAAALPGATQGVADLVAKKADDATLKAALKDLHEKFDVLEEGCVMPKAPKH
jgi:hypothetical protein